MVVLSTHHEDEDEFFEEKISPWPCTAATVGVSPALLAMLYVPHDIALRLLTPYNLDLNLIYGAMVLVEREEQLILRPVVHGEPSQLHGVVLTLADGCTVPLSALSNLEMPDLGREQLISVMLEYAAAQAHCGMLWAPTLGAVQFTALRMQQAYLAVTTMERVQQLPAGYFFQEQPTEECGH